MPDGVGFKPADFCSSNPLSHQVGIIRSGIYLLLIAIFQFILAIMCWF